MPGRLSSTLVLALAIGAVGFVTGCGESPARPPPSDRTAELAWIHNAEDLITQLTEGVMVSAAGGTNITTARRALEDQSELLAMLMANVAFGSCEESLQNIGVADARLRGARSTLGAACRLLQQASALFTRAVDRSDPRVLIRASSIALDAGRLLDDASIRLDVLRDELDR